MISNINDMQSSTAKHYGDKVMPIAIIGEGGRFPGDATNPQKLWDLLAKGQHAWTKTPPNRYNVDAFYHPYGERIDAQHFVNGCFMQQDPEAFDAPFFSISPGEAKAMDPQHRMCMEVAYEAMENAGLRLDQVRGTPTAVYIGAFTKDYRSTMAYDPDNYPWYFSTGITDAALSNRVSWFYDLRGPSMTLDTACSSSLSALHLACQSLRTEECKMALVGGVNFVCFPEYNVTMSTMHFLSPDGKSKTFDHKANGYGRGEGCCFVVLKPLASAIENGDVIRAVIRNTGCNQDGQTPGFAFPSGEAQAALIRDVYSRAGLEMSETGYFEAHGTGTAVGDPTETKAIGMTIGASRSSTDPLWIGSIKPNIGHLEGASGIVSLLKAVHILEHAKIPPQVWLDKVNPRIDLDKLNLAIPRHLTPWPNGKLRRVAVNSFGFGGSNALAIVEDAYHYFREHGIQGKHFTVYDTVSDCETPSTDCLEVSDVISSSLLVNGTHATGEAYHQTLNLHQPSILVWSAHEQSGIERIARSYKSYLERKNEISTEKDQELMLKRLTYTTALHRTHMAWRSFTVATNLKGMEAALSEPAPAIRSAVSPGLAFIFSGQGAQWYAMGRGLLVYDAFSNSLDDASHYLRFSLDCPWSLKEEFCKDESTSKIDHAAYSQPICTALQVAMVELLRSWGIRPSAVAGHSSGEIAAAFAKGAITREDAWTIAYERGRCSSGMQLLAPSLEGSMLAASLNLEEADEYISRTTSGTISVACVNSPSSVTLSGDRIAIDEIEALLRADGKFTKKLNVQIAYHSEHMKIVSNQYLEALQKVTPLLDNGASPIMFSSVTGKEISNADLGPSYWVANMLNTVQFSSAVSALLAYRGSELRRRPSKPLIDMLVEIGPYGVLRTPIKQIFSVSNSAALYFITLNKEEDAALAIVKLCGKLFQQGYPIDFEGINPMESCDVTERHALVDLPPYPWNHGNRYWHESALTHGFKFRKFPRDDLIGSLTPEANEELPSWRHFLRVSENPWLEDHVVHNTLLFPACGMAAMAIQAASQLISHNVQISGYELRDILINHAMIVPRNEEGIEISIRFQPWRHGSRTTASDWTEFLIYSRLGREGWTNNCTGLIRLVRPSSDSMFANELAHVNSEFQKGYLKALSATDTFRTQDEFYEIQKGLGVDLRGVFRNVFDVRKGSNLGCCAVKIPDIAAIMPGNYVTKHVIHPCVLDSIIGTLLPAVEEQSVALRTAAVPTYIGQLFVSADIPSIPGTIFETYSSAGYTGLVEAEGSACAALAGWEKPLVAFERVRLTRLTDMEDVLEAAQRKASLRKTTGNIEWQLDVSKANKAYVQDVCGQNDDCLAQLLSFVKLLAHKNPALRILEIAVDKGHIAKPLVNALVLEKDMDPAIHSYTVSDKTLEVVAGCPVIGIDSHATRVTSRKLDILIDPLQQGFKLAEFDLVIVTNLSEKALNNVKMLLKPGGNLVIARHSRQEPVDIEKYKSGSLNLLADQWHPVLLQYGFNGAELAFSNHKQALPVELSFITTTLPAGNRCSFPQELIIVMPDDQLESVHQLATILGSFLHYRGSEVETVSLSQLSKSVVNKKTLILLIEVDRSLLFQLDDANFNTIQKIVLEAENIIWVTRGGVIECRYPEMGLAPGFVRTIRSEMPGISFKTLDLDPDIEIGSESSVDGLMRILDALTYGDPDSEFAIRQQHILVPRIKLAKDPNNLLLLQNTEPKPKPMALHQESRALTLSIEKPSMLDTLYFKDDPNWQTPLNLDEVEIDIRASGLNFMDIMVGMGQIQESGFGLECSGIVSRIGSSVKRCVPGDRVVTWALGSIGNRVRNFESMIQPIPDDMTFETAASLPIIFTTAYTSLIEEARLKRNEKILIHGAAGGVGQAAIQIAQHIGAEIFATVSTEAKKQHIIDQYGIAADHIFYSRDHSFADGVKRLTGGRGVDVVLNSLAGEALRLSWHCLAWFGRFVELGKKDITNNSGLDMSVFIKNTSFHAINIIGMLRANVDRASQLFQEAMDFVRHGHGAPVRPLTIMSYSQVEEGFRLLQSGKHTGKIVFQAEAHDIIRAPPRRIQEVVLSSKATYVLSGGLGGVGRSISRWMAGHGARHLVFLGRSGASGGSAQAHLQSLREMGVNAAALTCDIGDEGTMKEVAEQIRQTMPPVQGIIQAAMSLADAAFQNMTGEQWRFSTNSKAAGTMNLHNFFPKDVDFFIILASSSGIVGNPGQSNYAAGNTFQDALAHHRVAKGLKAVTIDCGPILGAGHVAENASLLENLTRQGAVPLQENEIIALVQAAITGVTVNNNAMPTQLITGFATGGYIVAEELDAPYYHDDIKFHHIREVDIDASALSASAAATWQIQLQSVSSLSQASELIAIALRERLAKFLMISPDDIDLHKPASHYGVDSLTAVEIRGWSFRDLQSDISIFDVMSKVPLSSLARTVAIKSKFVSKDVIESDM